MIADNIKSVTLRIARCCEKVGAPEGSVKLISVTKEADIAQIEEVLRCGIRDLGENRVQDLVAKYNVIGDRAVWHLIGHLQTNKVKDAVKIASLIHSVDSIKLAANINKEAAKIGKTQAILIQVNVSGEASKFGIGPDELPDLIKECSSYQNIDIKGLMTIAPEVDDPEKVRPYFRALCELRDKLGTLHPRPYNLQLLSMGMSNDFEVAIEEGANMVRVGRAIFSA